MDMRNHRENAPPRATIIDQHTKLMLARNYQIKCCGKSHARDKGADSVYSLLKNNLCLRNRQAESRSSWSRSNINGILPKLLYQYHCEIRNSLARTEQWEWFSVDTVKSNQGTNLNTLGRLFSPMNAFWFEQLSLSTKREDFGHTAYNWKKKIIFE